MLKFKQFIFSVSIFSLMFAIFAPTVVAQTNVPVEFIVPDTTLVVTGRASPGALVSIYDDNTLIGSAVAGSDGRFSKEFVALDSGLHNIKLDYVDQSGRKSRSITDTVSLAFQKETSIDYFLPPTFEIVPGALTEGGLVSFRGSTVPGAQVEISVDGGNTTLRPQADANGNYTIALSTSGYFIGNHPASAQANIGGESSYETDKKTFEVLPVPSEQRPDEDSSDIQPPVIVSPPSPYSTDSEEILLRGTAQPNTQIIIYVDGEPVGSTFSNNEGIWFFNLKLASKDSVIQAIACLDNGCSDFSNRLEAEFTGEFGSCTSLSFRLLEYRFWGLNPDDGIDLEFSEISGVPEYEMIVDWGDGVVERFNHSDQNGFRIHHVYRETGQFNGNVTILDSDGCEATRYFSVDVSPRDLSVIDLWWVIPLLLAILFVLILRFNQRKDDLKDPKNTPKASKR